MLQYPPDEKSVAVVGVQTRVSRIGEYRSCPRLTVDEAGRMPSVSECGTDEEFCFVLVFFFASWGTGLTTTKKSSSLKAKAKTARRRRGRRV
jgi:hypothetical protein